MIPITYPATDFRYKTINDQRYIFDPVRKQYILLTPEEWVRQNFVQYLLQVKKYPASLMNIEKEIKLGSLKKRCDIIMYNQQMQPWMIVECKAEAITTHEKTFQQLLRYNMALPVTYLLFTNGQITIGYHRHDNTADAINEIPEWGS